MKILAIRGENIASLAGEFSVDFEKPPLNNQGLIAITGKTGSGKSTLLDCLCLALYEQVPRFDSESRTVEIGSEVQTERLKANDIRNLVSRGKAEATAEVLFQTSDQHRYLARWQVRRARNQVSGRWQASSRELIDLKTNQPFSANKREFQQHIDELIGLNYEQFRRSVMLAQGDFAAFLKAPEDQRSALLERMTGTELYSQISQQVYEHHKEQLAQLDKLQEQLDQVTILDEESRSELRQQLHAQQQRQNELVQAEQTQRQLAVLLTSLDEALQQQKQARQALDSHQQQGDAIGEFRQQLTQLTRLAPVKTLWQQRHDHQHQLDELQQQQESLQHQFDEQQQHQQQLEQQVVTGQKALEQFEQAVAQQAGALQQARELDGEIKLRQQQSAQLETRLAQSHEQQLREQHQLQHLQHQRDELQTSLQAVEKWLAQHQQQARWNSEQARIEPLLSGYQKQARELHYREQLHGEIEQLQRQQHQIDVAIGELKPALSQFKDELDKRQQKLNEGIDFQGQFTRLTQQREQLLQRYNRLEQLGNELRSQQQCHSGLQQLQQLQQQLISQQQALKQQLLQVESALTEAREQYANARQVVDLSHYRQHLQPGTPCPLCGSEQHPYLNDTVLEPVATILEQLQQRGEQLASQQINLEGQRRALVEKQRLLQQQERQLLEQWQLGEQRYQTWLPLFPELTEQTDGLEWISQQQRQSEQQADELYQQLQAIQQRWQQWEQLRKEIEPQHSYYQQRYNELRDLEAQQQLVCAQLVQHRQSLGQLDESHQSHHVEALQQQLDELFSDYPWLDYLAQMGVDGVLHWVHSELQEYQQVVAQQSALEQHQLQLHGQLQEQQLKLDYAVKSYEVLRQELTTLHERVTEQQQQRQTLLDGLSVEQWLARQQAQRQQLQQQQQTISVQRQQSGEALASLKGQLHTQANRQAQLKSAQRELTQRWQQVLNDYQLEEASCEPLFQIEPQRIDQMQQQVHAYEQQQLVLNEQLKNREQGYQTLVHQVEQHQSLLERQLNMLELEDVQALNTLKEQLDEQIYQLRKQLDGDEQARQHSQQLHADYLKQQQESAVWEQLNQLIGSASGAKFRTFAQQLTLDKLLFEANRQLLELAPRYQLQRVPGSSLALQIVDLDMGDEIRALASLSGGETFLVSLALALALSAVSSRNLQIQSLFIDEGFGSLDPDSLDIVMGCLDKLQASGRQVTAISHVQAMVERISAKIRLLPQGSGVSQLLTQID
ncbi:AAA family ATPase [Celerinatantimonas sp. YJH-8]|uniref:AAA family ATPase n=1 Tax=Celerinatantimonas sp. YJH-8 TaxID=3228714 RepID=UPI0038CA6900